MEQKKRDVLIELLGDEDLVNEVLAKAKDINARSEDPSAVFKETEEGQPGGGEALPDQSATPDPQTEEKGAEEAPEAEEKSDGGADLMVAVTSLREQVEALSAEVKAVQERSNAPRVAIHRPTVSSEASEETEIKEAGGTPRVVSAIGSAVLGR